MIIPHTLTVGGMVIGIATAPWTGLGPVGAVLGGALGSGLILALAYGYRLVRGQIGMGGGDVMLMGMVGTYLGGQGVLLVLFGGALLGSVYALVKSRDALTGQTKLPFGTFLAMATALTLLFGQPILQWYRGLLA